ncbi:MAG: polysaccharide biosynthesis protein [Clostridiales bacterium]|nr:polysaccharide biosynthesis protein [Clostridiales bacterium]
MKNKKIMYISSTGGHLNELLQLKELFKKYDYYIVTEKTKSSEFLKSEYEDKVSYLAYETKKRPIKYIFVFIYNIIKSLGIFIMQKPNIIITTGTHTAVPMCYIGKLFRKKIIFIETFANRNTKTVAGRLVYPIADTFVVQWEEMLKLYPKAQYWGWIY